MKFNCFLPRSFCNIQYLPVKTLQISDLEKKEMLHLPSGIFQVAFVIRFLPSENGECPLEAINPQTGEIVYPW